MLRRAVTALVLLAAPLAAQEEVTITGRVVAPDGSPVASARVEARVAAPAAVRATVTDDQGRYRLLVPASAREVVLSVERIGFVPATTAVAVAGAPVVRDLRMAPVPVMLAPIVAEAARRAPQTAPMRRQTPGESSASETAVGLEGLPVAPGDLTAIAALTPGVLAVGGDDAGFPAVSMAGQDPSQNRTTLDGTGYGSGALPPEAMARADVITSAYDVSRGRFSGGQIAVSTRAGTDVWGSALGASLRTPLLGLGAPAAESGRRDLYGQVSGGGGGPLVSGRLYGYAAALGSRRAADAPFLDTADEAGLRALALNPQTVAQFYATLARVGFPAGVPGESVSEAGSVVVRLDWLPGERHTVTARLDARGSRLSGVGSTPLAAAGSAGRIEAGDAGGMAQLVSRFGALRSEVRGYLSAGSRRTSPASALPAVQVRVGEGDGGTVLSAGAALLPGGDHDRAVLELSQDLSLVAGGGTHEPRAGVSLVRERARVLGGGQRAGTFVFASLDDLEAGRPASFSRTLEPGAREGTATQAALYLGDVWRPRAGLALTYGARLEHAAYPDRPAYDAALSPFLAGRPGSAPSATTVSPRAGFTYRTSPDWALRGGAGRFQGVVPVVSVARALGETGDPAAALQLVCTGAAAPVPDWAGYAADAGAIPERCADGAETFSARTPNATVFAPGFRAPDTWRASLGGNRRLGGRHFLDFEGTVVRGAFALAVDRNLPDAPVLTLAAEGGRPFFALPTAVDPRTGAVSGAARPLAELGTVRELGEGGRSMTWQAGVGVTGLTPWTGAYGVRYTWTRSRDRTTGTAGLGGSAATTAGDPRRDEWAAADLERTHYFQGLVSHRLSRGLEVALVGTVVSGIPYSPLVDGDVNGDGMLNDRAFVFAPETAGDPVLADGMARLLEDAPAAARACLQRSLGRVAARNACRSPWGTGLDLQANLRPTRPGMSRRLQVRVSTQNLLAAVDQLVHGRTDMKGWGQVAWVDPVLLRVRAFDPAAGAFRYEANPAFGQPLAVREGLRRPFGVVVQGRFTLGADPAFQQLATAVQALQGARRSPEEVRRELEAQLPNVPAAVLAEARRGRLELAPEQAARLRAAADSLAPRLGEVVGSLTAQVNDGGNRFTPEVRALLERGQALVGEGVEAARGILTPRQWNRLPRALREPAAEPALPGQRVTLPTG